MISLVRFGFYKDAYSRERVAEAEGWSQRLRSKRHYGGRIGRARKPTD